MAIAFEMRFKGGTTAQYNKVIRKMGFKKRGKGAPAGLFHWCAVADGGLLVVDVWESQRAFDKFAKEQIIPYTAAAGLKPPSIKTHKVYNYLFAG